MASLILCVGLQAAAQCYIDLIIKESDNNVKLIVLDRLIELKEHPTHERVLQVGGTQTKVEVLGQCVLGVGRRAFVNSGVLTLKKQNIAFQ